MNEQLLLGNIRSVLIRLEETIIFALIERAQFLLNAIIYRADAVDEATGGKSLVGYLLHETEKIHAKMRRYTSPDEHPFFQDLPAPILQPLRYHENPLKPNDLNLNAAIRTTYEEQIAPYICRPGDDGQYGSSSVCDVNCLQALSKRIHYGKFVAESKYQSAPQLYDPLIVAGAREAIMETITDKAVEANVLERVRLKSKTYGQDVAGDPTQSKIDAERVADVYARWIIPMTKQVEVEYLLQERVTPGAPDETVAPAPPGGSGGERGGA